MRDALWPALASLGSLCVRLQRIEAARRAGRAPSHAPALGAAFADPGTPVPCFFRRWGLGFRV